MNLITVDDIETYIGTGLSSEQYDRAEMLIDMALGEIESYLGRVVEETVFTENVDIDSEGRIFVSNTPITDVESVVIDGEEVEPEKWQATKWGIQYLWYSAFLYYPEVATVTYTAGLPDRGIKAVNSLILFGVLRKLGDSIPLPSQAVSTSTTGDVKRVRVEDYEYEYENKKSSESKMYGAKASAIAIFPSEKDFVAIKRYKKVRSA